MSPWTVTSPDRLDLFLAKDGRVLSRSKAKDMIERGLVTVNGAAVTKPSHRLEEGDTVALEESEDEAIPSDIEPVDLKLSVLHEDDACLVIDKPAGIAVHPGAGMGPDDRTMLNGIAFLFAERGLPFSADAVLVHRLDIDTTGCLLVAKTPEAHRFLQKQFEERTVRKEYLAAVAGVPDPPSAVIDASIGRSSSDRTKMTIYGSGKTRAARTTYRTLYSTKDAALLACELHTGRTHQIRVHLSSLGHPILGDETYANPLAERVAHAHGIEAICLHAWRLRFQPYDGAAPVACESALPSPFADAIAKTGLSPGLPSR